MGFFEGSMDHWTQAYNTCSAGECPAQIWWPNPTYVVRPPEGVSALAAASLVALESRFV